MPSMPKLKTLRIMNSKLRASEVKGLLSCCSGLRTFCYEDNSNQYARDVEWNDSYNDSYKPQDEFGSGKIVNYLKAHKRTLTSLYLETLSAPISIHPPSLREFSALEEVFIKSTDIWREADPTEEGSLPTEILPSTMVFLYIIHPDPSTRHLNRPSWLIPIHGLAAAVSQDRFPKLKCIECEIQRHNNMDASEALFAEAGVDFIYVKPGELWKRRR